MSRYRSECVGNVILRTVCGVRKAEQINHRVREWCSNDSMVEKELRMVC